MAKLFVTRGLPASGKTTYAVDWVEKDRAHRARVNRDLLREMIDKGVFVAGITEPRIVAARDAAILALLRKDINVINDDTNLPQRVIRDLARLAKRAGADFEVINFTDVPLEECLRRDAAREDKDPIGETVIREMHTRFLRGRTLPLPLPEEDDSEVAPDLYVPPLGKPETFLVDVDGTVALMGTRSPFDWSRVHEDKPNWPVILVIRALYAAGYKIIFLSGRKEGPHGEIREATWEWLREHVAVEFDLIMRPDGDTRKDSIVKRELFDKFIRGSYNVVGVLDDRNQVVQMWRSLGLTVMQVAEGNF